MKNLFLALFGLLISVQGAMAQHTRWEGAIQVPGSPLGIEVELMSSDSALISIPMQGAKNLPLQNVRWTTDSLSFQLPANVGLASFRGKRVTADSIYGQFLQRGQQFPFYLTKGPMPLDKQVTNAVSVNYQTRELEIQLSDGLISGTLTYPNQPGRFPLVILISGSGLQNRDEEVAGFKIFKEISSYLTRSDYAVFRYDDRGIGKSKIPDPTQSTIQDLADEVISIMDHMRDVDPIMPGQTVLLGHSQGGIIALEVAKQTRRLEGIILMATPAYPGKKIILQQIQKNLELSGQPQAKIDSNLALQKAIYNALDDSSQMDKVSERYKNHLMKELQQLPEERLKQLGDLNQFADQQIKRQLTQLQTPANLSYLRYDPLANLEQVEVPVLILQGEKDVQVVADPNIKRFRTKLDSAQIKYEIHRYPQANHLFQAAQTGLVQEYSRLNKEFIEGFLTDIVAWLSEVL